MSKKIYVLDATLRDGGQGLDDLFNNGFSDRFFTNDVKRKIISLLEDSMVEIIELGAMGLSEDDKRKFSIYQNVEDLSKFLPVELKQGKNVCWAVYWSRYRY